MRRICFIKTYVTGEAGPEISYSLLLRHLANLGIAVHVIEFDLAASKVSAFDFSGGTSIASYALRVKWGADDTRRLSGIIDGFLTRMKIDMVDMLCVRKMLTLYSYLCQRKDIPFFLRFYHPVSIDDVVPNQTIITTARERKVLRGLLRSMAGGISLSDYIREKIESSCGCPLERVVTIPDGIDTSMMGRRTPLPSGRVTPYILFLGRLEHSKGVDLLLFAFHDLLVTYPELNLLIAGKGRQEGHLKKLAAHLGIGEKVTFLGWQDYGRIPGLIKGAEFVVLPSRIEPFGRPAIEALACGKAIVASKAGGMPEIIEHRVNGMLVDPAVRDIYRGMRTLHEDKGLLRAIEAANRMKAASYDIRGTARRHIEFYEKTCARIDD